MVHELWNNSIGRISTAGIVTNYTGTGINEPESITAGPDEALWFTNRINKSIGRVTTSGVVTNYTGTGIDYPTGITSGPDGAIWFTNVGNNTIGRITTSGAVSNYTSGLIDRPGGIVTGPDGALWFTNNSSGSICKITTAGVVTKYYASGIDKPGGITAGPDGALWFGNSGSIGRITTSGSVTLYYATGSPHDITTGPDGALWFTIDTDTIARITAVPEAHRRANFRWSWNVGNRERRGLPAGRAGGRVLQDRSYEPESEEGAHLHHHSRHGWHIHLHGGHPDVEHRCRWLSQDPSRRADFWHRRPDAVHVDDLTLPTPGKRPDDVATVGPARHTRRGRLMLRTRCLARVGLLVFLGASFSWLLPPCGLRRSVRQATEEGWSATSV